MTGKKKIAVVGSGISGLVCAWLLSKDNDVTLFEKNHYLGGHSNTAAINYDNKPINVDTGFIVFNFKTYPNLKRMFEYLNVAIEKSNMSFGLKDLKSGFEYSGTLSGIFSKLINIANVKFFLMLKDIIKFNLKSKNLHRKNAISDYITLKDYIKKLKLGEYFTKYYLSPMASAIWSCPTDKIMSYPAKTFIQFFYNHDLLNIIRQPQWYTVTGGSKEYVQKIIEDFSGKVKKDCMITYSRNTNKGVVLKDSKEKEYKFDHVIFASHSDQTIDVISDITAEEKQVLGNIKYSKNKAVLHKDIRQMPVDKTCWASWVSVIGEDKKGFSLNYWMNNLQNIDTKYPLFVTLNPLTKIKKQEVFAEYSYEHPVFDFKAINAQKNLEKIQGKRNIWFCGAWTKYGFHEDGLNSALKIIKKIGGSIPWEKS